MQQRPIKFRAWDKIEAQMWPVTLINFDAQVAALEGYEGELQNVGTQFEGRRRNKPLSLLVLKQFTGLLDEVEAEICEGDVWREEGYEDSEIKFMNGAFLVHGQLLMDHLNGMVVGNIHTNPDLIESGAKQPAQ